MKNADIMRLICIWFMVTSHLGSDIRNAIISEQWMFIILFDGLARLSSPGLGFLAGYFAYLSLARYAYPDFLIKRARSLLGPFLIWSTIYVVLLLAVSFLQDEPLNFAMLIGNELWGITSWPGNYPLHFLLDLFKCGVLIAGVFALLTGLGKSRRSASRSLFGLSIVIFIGLTLNDLNGGHPGRNQDSFLPRSDLLLFFALGFIYADRGFKVFDTLAKRPIALMLIGIVFVLTSLVWREFLQEEIPSPDYVLGVILYFACRFAGSILLFSLIWRLPTLDARTGPFLRNLAFNVFVSHFIVLSAVNSLFDLAPLMAYAPLIYIVALQSVFVLAALPITFIQYGADQVDLVRRATSWFPSLERREEHR